MAGIEGAGETYTWTKDKVGPIYISRPVVNADQILQWYRTQGVQGLYDPKDLYITVVYSEAPVEWGKAWEAPEGRVIQGTRSHDTFGDYFVLKMEDKYLSARHDDLRNKGCSHKWPNYHPHISLSQAVPLDSVEPYTGPVYAGPERYEDIWENMEPETKGFWDDPLIFSMPCIIKSQESGGRRLIQVEASCQTVDLEGDVIMQKALLDSASSFVANGHLDIDHKSEPAIARRLGITNCEHYIVGRPYEVVDGGDGRTFVKGEISRSRDGGFDPKNNMADMLWDSLQRKPPVVWYASIFGYPVKGLTKNCRSGNCEMGARRFLIQGMNWKSLALTRNPVNNSLKGEAKIITAKAWAEKNTIGMPMGGLSSLKSCMEGGHGCPNCGGVLQKAPSLTAWRRHFTACSGMDENTSEICSHAALYKKLLDNLGVL